MADIRNGTLFSQLESHQGFWSGHSTVGACSRKAELTRWANTTRPAEDKASAKPLGNSSDDVTLRHSRNFTCRQVLPLAERKSTTEHLVVASTGIVDLKRLCHHFRKYHRRKCFSAYLILVCMEALFFFFESCQYKERVDSTVPHHKNPPAIQQTNQSNNKCSQIPSQSISHIPDITE